MARFLIASWDGGGNTPPAYHLGAALVTIGDHLAPTALRVAATDHQLTLALRPGALPEPLRERFDAEQSLRHSLDTSTAVELLKLVHDKILAPFPDDGRFPGEEERPARGTPGPRTSSSGPASLSTPGRRAVTRAPRPCRSTPT